MDNPEKLTTLETQKKQNKKTQHNMRWTPLSANKQR
jgi:hypothetical protein